MKVIPMNNAMLAEGRNVPARNGSGAIAMIFILTLVFAPLFALHVAVRWQADAPSPQIAAQAQDMHASAAGKFRTNLLKRVE